MKGPSKRKAKSRLRLSMAIGMILLLYAWLCPGTFSAGEFYRWVDENGVVHVSDAFPPEDKKGWKESVQRVRVPFTAPQPMPWQADEYRIPFYQASGGGIIVQGVLDDTVPVNLLFDTGASHMVISETLAKQLKPSSHDIRKIKVHTAGGSIEARTSMIAKVALGDVFKENVPALVTERDTRAQGFDAILGLSFLRDFKATVDYQNSEIILKRP